MSEKKYYLHVYTDYCPEVRKYHFHNVISELDAGDFAIYLRSFESNEYSWLSSVEITEEQFKKLSEDLIE